jgi:hypothetical protein
MVAIIMPAPRRIGYSRSHPPPLPERRRRRLLGSGAARSSHWRFAQYSARRAISRRGCVIRGTGERLTEQALQNLRERGQTRYELRIPGLTPETLEGRNIRWDRRDTQERPQPALARAPILRRTQDHRLGAHRPCDERVLHRQRPRSGASPSGNLTGWRACRCRSHPGPTSLRRSHSFPPATSSRCVRPCRRRCHRLPPRSGRWRDSR